MVDNLPKGGLIQHETTVSKETEVKAGHFMKAGVEG